MAHSRRHTTGMLLTTLCGAVSLAACGSSNADPSTTTCSGTRAFPISAVDDSTREALPSPIVALEPNGLSHPSPDPNGAYVFGGQGDVNGTFSPPLPCGRWGVHVFVTGYRCQSLVSGNTGTLEIGLLPLDANDVVPVISQASWSNDAPKVGATVTLTLTTTAPSSAPEDAITGVVLAATATSSYRAIALAPAAAVESDGVTQVWQGKLLLPAVAGTLTYAVVAATADCRASKTLRLPIAAGNDAL